MEKEMKIGVYGKVETVTVNIVRSKLIVELLRKYDIKSKNPTTKLNKQTYPDKEVKWYWNRGNYKLWVVITYETPISLVKTEIDL